MFIVVAQDLPAGLAVGALGSQRATVTGARLGLVGNLASSGVKDLWPQDLSGGVAVEVAYRVVGRLLLTEEGPGKIPSPNRSLIRVRLEWSGSGTRRS
jgi:hypothetical protein